jgi:hypothetical protein
MAVVDIDQKRRVAAYQDRPHPVETWLGQVTGKGKIDLAPMEWLPLEFLCFNMREIDRHEIYANLPTSNPIEWANWVFHNVAKNGCAWIAALDGRPTAVMGIYENFPGNWEIFSFGTPDYIRVLVAFKPKWYLMIDYLRDHGGHRLQCRSLATHKEAHRFLKLMGFAPEAVLQAFGRDREDYILFKQVW